MADRREIPHHTGVEFPVGEQVEEGERAIGSIAARQHGLVARRQLVELGVSDRSIERRLAAGRLVRVHPGVYAVGYEARSPVARQLAAVMWCAPVAAASHTSAVFLWGLIPEPPGVVHVTAPEKRVRRRGVAIHRAALPAHELAVAQGVPVTTLDRTFLDLSESMPAKRLRRLIKEAEFQGLIRIGEIGEILDRYPRRPGRRTLASILAPLLAHPGRTRSPLEDEFLDFCAARGLPLPEANVRLTLGGRQIEADAMWRDARLIVELDGRDAHARELAFEDDRARDRAAIAAGWIPMRVTSAHLAADADQLEADIRSTLALSPTTDGRSPT